MPGSEAGARNEVDALHRAFLDPLALVLLTGVVGLLLRHFRRRLGNLVLAALGLSLALLSTPFLSALLLKSLEDRMPAAERGPSDPPEAIVVLSADLRHAAPEFGGDTVGPLTLERIRYAARLHKETGLPLLVTGGRIGGSEKTLALAMQETLEAEFQVPVRWQENEARNTYENALLSSQILAREGIEAAYLVTHAWHMARAVEAFGAMPVTAIPAPTAGATLGPGLSPSELVPSSRGLRNSAYALHEWLGTLWYRLRYY